MQEVMVHTTVLSNPSCSLFNANKNSMNREIKSFKFIQIPGDNPEKLEKFKKLVMRKFWEYQQKTYNSGLAKDDETYYPNHRESWEKKALVIINPAAGKGNGKQVFDKIERYLKAYGFRMETHVTTP